MVNGFQEIVWELLIFKDWDLMVFFKGLKLDQMIDDDLCVDVVLWKVKKYWKDVLVDLVMEGKLVCLFGFVVFLDWEGEVFKEFLLVFYFGVCIYVLLLLVNQIIYVKSVKVVKNVCIMDVVWISGVFKVECLDFFMGVFSYSMKVVSVEFYSVLDKG